MAEHTQYPRGSEWRKWDLHIHTPESIVQSYNSEQKTGQTTSTWERFIIALENLPDNVKVIGITDYYFIDGFQKVMEYKKQGRLQNIDKIFPILEFRIDTFGCSSKNKLTKINLHILFDIDESKCDKECEKITKEFVQRIPISQGEEYRTKYLSKDQFIEAGGTLKKGFDNYVPPTEKVFETINTPTWNKKTFIFLGYNEWSSLDSEQQVEGTQKDLYHRSHAFFSANPHGYLEKKQKWLDRFGNKPLLHSLDIHSFDALKPNLNDGNGYKCHTWIKSDLTFQGLKQIIFESSQRVRIQSERPTEKPAYWVIDSIKLEEKGFWECEIKLNPNLNSIIGGRSTGKSTLLKAIAKAVNPKVVLSNNTDSTEYDTHLASIQVKWLDQADNIGKEEGSQGREIEFFSQGEFADIAENPEKSDKLIQKILREDTEKRNLLDGLDSFEQENTKHLLENIRSLYDLQDLNTKKGDELKDLGDQSGIAKEIAKVKSHLEHLTKESALTDIEYQKYQEIGSCIHKNTDKITSISSDITQIPILKQKDLIVADFSRHFDELSIETRKELNDALIAFTKNTVQPLWKEELDKIQKHLENKRKEIGKEQETHQIDPIYIKGDQHIRQNTESQYLRETLEIEESKLRKSQDITTEKEIIQKKLQAKKESVIELHCKYWTEFDKRRSEITFSDEGIGIKAKYNIQSEALEKSLKENLKQQSKAQQKFTSDFIENYPKDIQKYTTAILDRSLDQNLDKKNKKEDLEVISALLAKKWFQITYELSYEKDLFSQMSPGKQAFVILKLLLEYSTKQCPILIDQPEDNLDNRAIYTELVQYLKKKKEERQIIIVTHNPNIVISADSELIIVANQDGINSPNKDGIKFHYLAGSIEHSFPEQESCKSTLEAKGTREHLCEILEGGTEAFLKREQQYNS